MKPFRRHFLALFCVPALLVLFGCDTATDVPELNIFDLGEPRVVTGFIPASEIPPGADTETIRALVKRHAASKTSGSWNIYEVGTQFSIPSGSTIDVDYGAWSSIKVDCSLFVGAEVNSTLKEIRVNLEVITHNNYLTNSDFLSGPCTSSDEGTILSALDDDEKTYAVPGSIVTVKLSSTHRLHLEDAGYTTITTSIEENLTNPGVYYQIKSL